VDAADPFAERNEPALDALKTGLHAIETGLDTIETQFQAIDAAIDVVEAPDHELLHGLKTPIDGIETLIDGVKAPIDGIETAIEHEKVSFRRLFEVEEPMVDFGGCRLAHSKSVSVRDCQNITGR
jgi:hypothetical protein